MKNFYNIRAKNGRFIQRFTPKNVRIGSLYGLKNKNIVVRAKKLLNNGTILISFHKTLFGFVKPEELQIIDKQQVEKYLDI